MKKFILITFLIAIISGCSDTTSTHSIQKDSSLSGIHDISYQDIQEKRNNNEAFILYIGRPDCTDCQEFTPLVEDYLALHPGAYLYYFNTKEYRDLSLESDQGKKDYELLRQNLDFQWTPTVHFIYDGKIEATYTYLDEEFYSLSNKQQEEKKQDYIENWNQWMDNIFTKES